MINKLQKVTRGRRSCPACIKVPWPRFQSPSTRSFSCTRLGLQLDRLASIRLQRRSRSANLPRPLDANGPRAGRIRAPRTRVMFEGCAPPPASNTSVGTSGGRIGPAVPAGVSGSRAAPHQPRSMYEIRDTARWIECTSLSLRPTTASPWRWNGRAQHHVSPKDNRVEVLLEGHLGYASGIPLKRHGDAEALCGSTSPTVPRPWKW